MKIDKVIMSADFYHPKSPILATHIEGFYFMRKDKKYPFQYYTFPNNYCILSLLNNVELNITGRLVEIKRSQTKNQISSLTFQYREPLDVVYLEPVDELTIYFKPNGINFFIRNMEDFYNKRSMLNFNPGSDFKSLFFEVFEIFDRDTQIEYIEHQLLSLFKSDKDDLIENLLIDLKTDLSIEEIAFKNNISRQHLNQYFKLKLGKSPSEFRKIARFRKSLTMMKNRNTALTEVSYENLFFDQSHFNRDFKGLTNFSPKEFFQNTDLEKNNVWFIL